MRSVMAGPQCLKTLDRGVRGTPGFIGRAGRVKACGLRAGGRVHRTIDAREKCSGRYGLSFSLASARVAASVAAPASVVRLSDMRWMPRPDSCAFLEERVRVLTPIQAISDDS